jgi:hypothetical protein
MVCALPALETTTQPAEVLRTLDMLVVQVVQGESGIEILLPGHEIPLHLAIGDNRRTKPMGFLYLGPDGAPDAHDFPLTTPCRSLTQFAVCSATMPEILRQYEETTALLKIPNTLYKNREKNAHTHKKQ